MRKITFLILVSFFYSLHGYSQKVDGKEIPGTKIIGNSENISNIDFGIGNDLFVRTYDGKVKKADVNSGNSSDNFIESSSSIGVVKSTNELVKGSPNGDVVIYKDDKVLKTINAHSSRVTHITVSQSNKYIATASLDKTIKIWKTDNYEVAQEINTSSDLVTDIKFSLQDNYLVYTTKKGKVLVWDIVNNKVDTSHQITEKWLRSIAISPDGTTYAVAGDDKTITILSFKDSSNYKLEDSHTKLISNIEFLNKDYILSMGHDNKIVMNSIHTPTDKEGLKNYGGYPQYRVNNTALGDRYFSDISISEENKIVAISSSGNGIVITDYFHNLVEKPHKVLIREVDGVIVNPHKHASEYRVNNKVSIIKAEVTRPKQVKKIEVQYVKDGKRVKVKMGVKGNLEFQVTLEGEAYDFRIVIEDWDDNLHISNHDFKLIRNIYKQ